MDDKLNFLLKKLNQKRKRKKHFDKLKELQVEVILKIMLIIPRNYILSYKK